MICDKCGKQLPDEAEVCDNCGQRIYKSPNYVDETDMFNVGSDSLKDVPEKNKVKSTIIVTCVAALIVLVFFGAVFVKAAAMIP